jgi:rod shape determining protein RodA
MHRSFDFLTFFLILAIGSLSLLTLFSLNRALYTSQLIFWIIGLAVFYLGSNLDHQFLKKIAVPLYVLSIVLLVVLFWVGEPIRGSIRWFDFGIFRLQPSEIVKIATIFVLASFFQNRSAANIKNVLLSLLIISPAVFLIFRQPDLGNALCIVAIWFGMAFVAGFSVKHILVLSLAAVILGIIGFEILSPYQQVRVASFMNPAADPLGTGYNIIQSKIAIGSGGIFGRGLGRGSQSQLNFLPEAESDFIFASITEQLGFLGAAILIALFVFLISRVANFAKKQDRLVALLITGTCSFLIFQFTVNIGMNLGLLPVTGITLPLVSYGGSSLVSTLFLLGVAFSIKRHQALN